MIISQFALPVMPRRSRETASQGLVPTKTPYRADAGGGAGEDIKPNNTDKMKIRVFINSAESSFTVVHLLDELAHSFLPFFGSC